MVMNEDAIAGSQYQKALNTAIRLLVRRDHTVFELLQKLKRRGFDPGTIEAILAECKRLNYINDERTARLFIGQLAAKGFGLRRIRMELKKKGLKGDRFEAILRESASEIDEREIAQRILQKKIKSYQREADEKKRKAKIYRFLNARGFSDTVISEMIAKFS